MKTPTITFLTLVAVLTVSSSLILRAQTNKPTPLAGGQPIATNVYPAKPSAPVVTNAYPVNPSQPAVTNSYPTHPSPPDITPRK